MSERIVAENIERLKPYHPGTPIEEVQRQLGLTDVIKLASNESPLGPSPRAIEAIKACAYKAYLYPEGAAPLLRTAIATRLQVSEDSLVFGNGSDEVLHLICETFLTPGSDQMVQADPTFAMYEIYGTLANAEIVKVPLVDYTHDLAAMADAVTDKTRLLFVANPNNPTGTLVRRKEVERLIERLPARVLLVFDEAYDEFVDDPEKPDLLPLVRAGGNVIVLRTFSKAYALAGLRVGYGIARPELAGYLNRARSPFNVNLIAQAAALAAWNDHDHISQSVYINSVGRKQLYTELEARGIPYVPSQANFVLVDVGRDSREVYDALLKRGVIVRAGYGLGLPQHIRVSVGTGEQISRFMKELCEIL